MEAGQSGLNEDTFFSITFFNEGTVAVTASVTTTLDMPLYRTIPVNDLKVAVARFRVPTDLIPLTHHNIPHQAWKVGLGFNSTAPSVVVDVPQFNAAVDATPTFVALAGGTATLGEISSDSTLWNPNLDSPSAYTSATSFLITTDSKTFFGVFETLPVAPGAAVIWIYGYGSNGDINPEPLRKLLNDTPETLSITSCALNGSSNELAFLVTDPKSGLLILYRSAFTAPQTWGSIFAPTVPTPLPAAGTKYPLTQYGLSWVSNTALLFIADSTVYSISIANYVYAQETGADVPGAYSAFSIGASYRSAQPFALLQYDGLVTRAQDDLAILQTLMTPSTQFQTIGLVNTLPPSQYTYTLPASQTNAQVLCFWAASSGRLGAVFATAAGASFYGIVPTSLSTFTTLYPGGGRYPIHITGTPVGPAANGIFTTIDDQIHAGRLYQYTPYGGAPQFVQTRSTRALSAVNAIGHTFDSNDDTSFTYNCPQPDYENSAIQEWNNSVNTTASELAACMILVQVSSAAFNPGFGNPTPAFIFYDLLCNSDGSVNLQNMPIASSRLLNPSYESAGQYTNLQTPATLNTLFVSSAIGFDTIYNVQSSIAGIAGTFNYTTPFTNGGCLSPLPPYPLAFAGTGVLWAVTNAGLNYPLPAGAAQANGCLAISSRSSLISLEAIESCLTFGPGDAFQTYGDITCIKPSCVRGTFFAGVTVRTAQTAIGPNTFYDCAFVNVTTASFVFPRGGVTDSLGMTQNNILLNSGNQYDINVQALVLDYDTATSGTWVAVMHVGGATSLPVLNNSGTGYVVIYYSTGAAAWLTLAIYAPSPSRICDMAVMCEPDGSNRRLIFANAELHTGLSMLTLSNLTTTTCTTTASTLFFEGGFLFEPVGIVYTGTLFPVSVSILRQTPDQTAVICVRFYDSNESEFVAFFQYDTATNSANLTLLSITPTAVYVPVPYVQRNMVPCVYIMTPCNMMTSIIKNDVPPLVYSANGLPTPINRIMRDRQQPGNWNVIIDSGQVYSAIADGTVLNFTLNASANAYVLGGGNTMQLGSSPGGGVAPVPPPPIIAAQWNLGGALIGSKAVSSTTSPMICLGPYSVGVGQTYFVSDSPGRVTQAGFSGTSPLNIVVTREFQTGLPTLRGFGLATSVIGDAGDFSIYTYQQFANQINKAFAAAMVTPPPGWGVGVSAPSIQYDAISKLFNLVLPLQFASSSPGVGYQIYLNTTLQRVFGFPTAGAPLAIVNGVGFDTIATADPMAANPYYRVYQEGSSMGKLFDLARVLVQSNGFTVNGNQEGANSSIQCITDTSPDTDTLSPASALIYVPYFNRWYSVLQRTALYRINIAMIYQTRRNKLFPIMINPGDYWGILLCFRRESAK